MDPSEMGLICARHNRIAWAKAAGFLLLAAVTWVISWFVMWEIVLVFTLLWGAFASLNACFWAAWVGVGLLCIEGFRYHGRVFDLEAYNKSRYYRIYSGGADRVSVGRYGNPLAAPYIISQFLLSAPRLTVSIIRSIRSRVSLSDEQLSHAADIVGKLRAKKGWVSVEDLTADGDALYALDRLKVIWTEAKDDAVKVRLDPDYEGPSEPKR